MSSEQKKGKKESIKSVKRSSEADEEDEEEEEDNSPKKEFVSLLKRYRVDTSHLSDILPFDVIEFLQAIDKEIANLTIDNLETDKYYTVYRYKCKHLFDGQLLDQRQLLLGDGILANPSSYDSTIRKDRPIQPDEIFIKAGSLKIILEDYFKRRQKEREFHKFAESNTFSKTYRLGIKRLSTKSGQRSVYFVNFQDALRCIRKEMLHKLDTKVITHPSFTSISSIPSSFLPENPPESAQPKRVLYRVDEEGRVVIPLGSHSGGDKIERSPPGKKKMSAQDIFRPQSYPFSASTSARVSVSSSAVANTKAAVDITRSTSSSVPLTLTATAARAMEVLTIKPAENAPGQTAAQQRVDQNAISLLERGPVSAATSSATHVDDVSLVFGRDMSAVLNQHRDMTGSQTEPLPAHSSSALTTSVSNNAAASTRRDPLMVSHEVRITKVETMIQELKARLNTLESMIAELLPYYGSKQG